MKATSFARIWFLLLILSLIAVSDESRAASQDYQPQVGQEGKDVVWVPTPQELVDKMLDMAKLTPKDYIIDLGSGGGPPVSTAAKRGSKAPGPQDNPHQWGPPP